MLCQGVISGGLDSVSDTQVGFYSNPTSTILYQLPAAPDDSKVPCDSSKNEALQIKTI